MKTYTFKITNKQVMNYKTARMVEINYNVAVNVDIFQSIRRVFENGVNGTKRSCAEFFKIVEKDIDNTVTIITNIDIDFNRFGTITVSAQMIPMRQKNYVRFQFDMEII